MLIFIILVFFILFVMKISSYFCMVILKQFLCFYKFVGLWAHKHRAPQKNANLHPRLSEQHRAIN